MKKVKLNLGLVALLLGFGLVATQSAFVTPGISSPKAAGYLFRYKLSTYSAADIQNIANYERNSSTCPNGIHVCGVYLPTNKPNLTQPDIAEFNAVKSTLWTSESNSSPANTSIVMKN